jgi:hypothetical protein
VSGRLRTPRVVPKTSSTAGDSTAGEPQATEDRPADAASVTTRNYHDSPAAKPLGPGKRKHWQRYKLPTSFATAWTNAKAGYVGFLTGRGYTSPEIEKILADGTSRETVRGMWRRWGLPLPETGGRRCAVLPVALSVDARRRLGIRAKKVGITPEEWIRRILISAVDDDLYDAVTDGRFDKKSPYQKIEKP